MFLVSHKKPQSDMPGYISVGGWDESYDYWERFGRLWDENIGVAERG